MCEIDQIYPIDQIFDSVGGGGSKHFRILLKIGMDSLFMKENSWYNVELDQRKSPKNETPYPPPHFFQIQRL